MADAPPAIAAPRLAAEDLRALALRAIEAGTATATGLYPRTYPVNATMRFSTGFPWNVR